jgi:hypothetical protein
VENLENSSDALRTESLLAASASLAGRSGAAEYKVKEEAPQREAVMLLL